MATDTDGKAVEDTQTEDGIGLELARSTLGDLVLRAGFGNERVLLTRKGRQIAAIVGLKDLERLKALDAAEAAAA